MYLLAFFTGIMFLTGVPTQGLAQAGHWEEVKSSDGSLPVARHEAAFVGVGDKFYLLGGRGIRPVSIFDPEADTWTEGAPPPVEMHHFQPFVWQEEVYIAGALTGPYPGEDPLPLMYIYNPQKDSWREGPEIPANRRRGSTGTVVYNGKIYLVAGIADGHRGDHKTWLDEYDPATGTWTALPDAPRARDHFQATVADDKLYVVGGRRSNAPDNVFSDLVAEVDVYDFKTKRWTTLDAPLPTLRAGTYNALYRDHIVVLGGETGEQQLAHNETEALDLEDHTWTTLAPMLQGRHGTGAILYDGKLYVASGSGNRGGGPELQTQECFMWED